MSDKKRSSYTVGFKLKVVNFAEEHSKHKAAKVFKVDRRMVIMWCKKKDTLKELPKDAKCATGQGRKVAFPVIEDRLLQWLKDRREKGGRVIGKALKAECIRLHRMYGCQSYKASKGWCEKFKKRNRIVVRKTTHISQKPKDLIKT